MSLLIGKPDVVMYGLIKILKQEYFSNVKELLGKHLWVGRIVGKIAVSLSLIEQYIHNYNKVTNMVRLVSDNLRICISGRANMLHPWVKSVRLQVGKFG